MVTEGGSVTDGVHVEPELLEHTAGDVELLREDFDKATNEVHSHAQEVGRKLASWRIARAAETSTFGWEDDAKETSGWLEDHATALERCALDYLHLDEVTAETLALFPELD